jgi:K(+)-stimulated pyrophosphate-energized sodium pump
LTAVVGIYLCRPRVGENGLRTINRAFYISATIGAVGSAIAAFIYLPGNWDGLTESADVSPRLLAAGAAVIGVVLACAILALTGYFTGTEHRPVKDVGRTSLTGAATVILSGLSVGFESAVYTALVIGAAVFGAALLAGGTTGLALFAVSLAGCGLLTTVGVIVAMDTFGPVSDNAQGIAEMSGEVDEEGARILTELDAVGNTTKAITKGIAIATAVLAASALFASYTQSAFDAFTNATGKAPGGILNGFLVFDAKLLVGALLGASVVFLFSGLAINAVGRAAGAVVFEVRRQFREIPGIMEGTGRPEYGKVVDIVTRDSLRELATPGILAILAPVAVGFGLGIGPLAGFLAGAITAGTLMAVFLANSGGAWDNAKKLVEDGHHGGKGSDAHAATVIGDTVGDPFKDTAGPAINPLLKVMNLVSLLIVAAVVNLSYGEHENDWLRILIAVAAAAGIIAAVYISKRRPVAIDSGDGEPGNVASTPVGNHT